LIVTDNQEALAAWAAEKMDTTFVPPYSAIGAIDQSGNIIAVFVFNNFTRNDIEISVAADRIPRELLKATYSYVVDQLGCQRASYRTRADNLPAQRCLERLGAQKEGVQRRYFGDCDSFMYGILREDFPFAHAISSNAS
jgi:RimJ/RimL family protein N-acetyltransferase